MKSQPQQDLNPSFLNQGFRVDQNGNPPPLSNQRQFQIPGPCNQHPNVQNYFILINQNQASPIPPIFIPQPSFHFNLPPANYNYFAQPNPQPKDLYQSQSSLFKTGAITPFQKTRQYQEQIDEKKQQSEQQQQQQPPKVQPNKSIKIKSSKQKQEEEEAKKKEKERQEQEIQRKRLEEQQKFQEAQKQEEQRKKEYEQKQQLAIEQFQRDQEIIKKDDDYRWKNEPLDLKYFLQFNNFSQIHCSKYDIPLTKNKMRIEDFNFTLAPQNNNELEQIVKDWILNLNAYDNFLKLIPSYFNILKRGEPWQDLVIKLNYAIKRSNKHYQLNIKQLFMIIFLNADCELQLMLLKLQYKNYPVPLLYREPYYDEHGFIQIKNRFKMNDSLLYIFEESFPIFCFSLGSAQKNQIGKTSLLNRILYKNYDGKKGFQEKDRCPNNKNTIDIMFDCAFGKSRKLSVAEAHGKIKVETLLEIGFFFYVWVIQIQYDDDYTRIIKDLTQILSTQRNSSSLQKIVIYVRDVTDKEDSKLNALSYRFNQMLQDNDIEFGQRGDRNKIDICNISNQSQQYKQTRDQISATKTLFQNIEQIQERKEFKYKTQNDFYDYFLKVGNQANDLSSQIKNINEIIDELRVGAKKEHAFLNESLFPMRNLDYQIKLKKKQLFKKKLEEAQQKTLHQEIEVLEKSKNNQKISKVIQSFINLLFGKNYYLAYLLFIDKLREFNNQVSHIQYEDKQQIMAEIGKLTEKQKITSDLDQQNILDKQIKDKQKQLQEAEIKFVENQIAIEIFWREIFAYCEFKILKDPNNDPTQVLFKMIKKGEPFEFLDGDNLKIDRLFMEKLCQSQENQGWERVLVLTVLGPQSSGKSTILNKIFGCHFWTSVGRCTKGIYAQLLKIQDKSLVNDRYDYLLILDSEGLQSPTQQDPEFDKKIALFITAVSDIILVNVKGDIHAQFKQLVEICIQTMGSISNNFSQIKQINWCFNQNADTTKKSIFLQQISDMADEVNKYPRKQGIELDKFNAADILLVNQNNVKALGFAQKEVEWLKDDQTGIWQDWAQTTTNDTFSQEAYIFGLQMIESMIFKKCQCQDEWKDEYTLKEFSLVSFSNWNIIQGIQDLSEFHQLKEISDDEALKICLEKEITKQLPNLNSDINSEAGNIIDANNLTYEVLSDYQSQLLGNSKSIYNRYDDKIQEQFKKEKEREKIQSKRLLRKYENLARSKLTNQRFHLLIEINGKIIKKQSDLVKIKGILLIEKEIATLLANEEELKNLKQNKQLENKFENKWGEIMQIQQKYSNDYFQGFQSSLYEILEIQFQNFIFKTSNNKMYFQKLQLNCQKQTTDEEFKSFYNHYQQEITSNINFMIIGKFQSQEWLKDIFDHQIVDKSIDLKLFNGYVTIQDFYEQKLVCQGISKKDFLYFIKNDIGQSFIQATLKKVNKFNDNVLKNSIRDYFSIFSYFGLKLKEDKFQDLVKLIKKCLKNPNNTSNEDAKVKMFFNQQIYTMFEQCNPQRITNYNKKIVEDLLKETYYLQIVDLDKDPGVLKYKENHPINNQKEFEAYIQDFKLEVKAQVEAKKQTNADGLIIQKFIDPQTRALDDVQLYKLFIQTYVAKSFNWEQLYRDIFYLIIKKFEWKENQQKPQFKIKQNNQNIVEEVENFINKSVMQAISNKITEVNKQLGYFGLMMNQIGEQLMYYFALLFSWRIICFKQWEVIQQSYQPLQNYKQQAKDLFIQQVDPDNQEVTKKMAQNFGQKIIEKLSEEKLATLKQNLKIEVNRLAPNFKVKVITQLCDQRIFEIGKSEIDMWNYIRNPVALIKEQTEISLINEFQKLINTEIQTYQNQIVHELNSFLATLVEVEGKFSTKLRSTEYFNFTEAPDLEKASNLLFAIFCVTVSGPSDIEEIKKLILDLSNEQNLFLKQEYLPIFQALPKNQFLLRSLSELPQKCDRKIIILTEYIKALQEYLKQNLQNYPKVQNDIKNLDIQNEYDAYLKLSIGCPVLCPGCNRKCDQENDHQKHKCDEGHYLRGMNGLVLNQNLSQLMCEEIKLDQKISLIEDPNNVITWQQVLSKHSSEPWDLSNETKKKKWETLLDKENQKYGNALAQIIKSQTGQQIGNFKLLTKEEMSGQQEIGSNKIHLFT